MNIKKRSKILLKVIKRIYEWYLDMQEYINSLMVDVFKEENVSLENTLL